jgi:hypothetical protein
VLLEPQKYVFQKYLEPLHRKTQGITVVNSALDKEDGFRPIYKISVSNSRWATGLASFDRKYWRKLLNQDILKYMRKKRVAFSLKIKMTLLQKKVLNAFPPRHFLK